MYILKQLLGEIFSVICLQFLENYLNKTNVSPFYTTWDDDNICVMEIKIIELKK